MNRRQFLKYSGYMMAAFVASPIMLADEGRDKFTLDLLQKLKAKASAIGISPVDGKYIAFIHPVQWIELQSDLGKRLFRNALITGELGTWNGVKLYESKKM